MMVGWGEEKEKDVEPKIVVDTILFKEFSEQTKRYLISKDEKDLPDFYDEEITLYEVYEKDDRQAVAANEGVKPTVFMMPGGAFLELVNDEIAQMDTAASLAASWSMAKRLAAAPFFYKVVIVRYNVQNNIRHRYTVFPTAPPIRATFPFDELSNNDSGHCQSVGNELGKARALQASYISYQSFRRVLQYYNQNSPGNGVDLDNVYLVGSSAGAVLALNALFLQQHEIPATIPYRGNCSNPNNINASLPVADTLKTLYWNLPKIKGVVTLNGAWIYDSLKYLTDTVHFPSQTAIYMLHGTCDEIIHRKTGRIGYKLLLNPDTLIYVDQNHWPANRFISGQGSETIFNLLKERHNKLTYGQVLRGGHGIFGAEPLGNGTGYWDIRNSPDSLKNPVFDEVAGFISRLVADSNDWETKAIVLDTVKIPEVPTTKCWSYDQFESTICYQKVYPPTITYQQQICGSTVYTATLGAIPQDATFQWTSSPNILLIGNTNVSFVQYKRNSSSNGGGSISVTISRPCATTKTFTYSVSLVSVNIGQGWLLSAGPFGISNHCGVTLALSNSETIPPNAQSIFSINVSNAKSLNIDSLEWEFNCGYIVSGPLNIWTGNNLYSEITVHSNSIGGPCSNIRVRPRSTCGGTGSWKNLNLNLNNCIGGWSLMLAPNPTSATVAVQLKHDQNEKIAGTFYLEVVDIYGNKVLYDHISDGFLTLDVSHLRQGQYRLVIYTPDLPISATINISR